MGEAVCPSSQETTVDLCGMRPHGVRRQTPFSGVLGPIWSHFAAPFWGSFFGPRFGAALHKLHNGGPKNAAPFWGRFLKLFWTLGRPPVTARSRSFASKLNPFFGTFRGHLAAACETSWHIGGTNQ